MWVTVLDLSHGGCCLHADDEGLVVGDTLKDPTLHLVTLQVTLYFEYNYIE
jgi:hypothetical protein